jgi:butyryl-CoA dehydrogenase
MNFFNDEIHQDMVDMYRDFAQNSCAPIAAELDEQERFPEENIPVMAEMGLLGIPFPEEYGGAGLSYLSYIATCEILAEYCATTSVMLSGHESLCCWPIFKYGTEEQKQKYLVPLAKGEKIGAFGLTEPNAGSDAGGTGANFRLCALCTKNV